MKLRWIDVEPGSIVQGKDGYEWTVLNVGPAPDGKPRGSIEVTMERPGREAMTGWPAAGAEIEVVSMPDVPPGAMRAAVSLLREKLGAEVIECAWCQNDLTAECVCDVDCGAKGCVNF